MKRIGAFLIYFFVWAVGAMEVNDTTEKPIIFEHQFAKTGSQYKVSIDDFDITKNFELALSEQNRILALPTFSPQEGQTVNLFSLDGKDLKRVCENGGKYPCALSFGSGDTKLLVGYQDCTASVIDVETGTKLVTTSGKKADDQLYPYGPKSIVETIEDRRFFLHHYVPTPGHKQKMRGMLVKYDMQTGKYVDHEPLTYRALSDDGSLGVRSNIDENKHSFGIFDIDTSFMTQIEIPKGATAPAPNTEYFYGNSVKISPDNTLFALSDTLSQQGKMVVSNDEGSVVAMYEVPEGKPILSTAFCANSAEVLVGIRNMIHRVEARKGNKIGTLPVDGYPEKIVCGNNTAVAIVSGNGRSENQSVYVWENLEKTDTLALKKQIERINLGRKRSLEHQT